MAEMTPTERIRIRAQNHLEYTDREGYCEICGGRFCEAADAVEALDSQAREIAALKEALESMRCLEHRMGKLVPDGRCSPAGEGERWACTKARAALRNSGGTA